MRYTGSVLSIITVSFCFSAVLLLMSCKDNQNYSKQNAQNEDQFQENVKSTSTYGINVHPLSFSRIRLESGTYIGECYKGSGDSDSFYKEEASIDDNVLVLENKEFLDADCTSLVRVRTETSVLTALELAESMAPVYTFNLSLLLKETKFTVHDEDRLKYFNQHKIYGIDNWVQDEPKDISGKRFVPDDISSYLEPKIKTTIKRFMKFDTSSNSIGVNSNLSSLNDSSMMIKK